MTRKKAEEHALHICRTMGVDDETALLSGLPTYLMGIEEATARRCAQIAHNYIGSGVAEKTIRREFKLEEA